MKKLDEPFTMIPNRLIHSKKLDIYDKMVFTVIARFNPSFPSYEKIAEILNISIERIWKSLRNLEQNNVIIRFKIGRSVHYKTHWTYSPDETINGQPIRYTNTIYSPDETVSIRQTKTNKTKEKDKSKKEEFLNGEEKGYTDDDCPF